MCSVLSSSVITTTASVILCALLLFTQQVSAQDTSVEQGPEITVESKFGVGFQSTWPAYGVSGMMDLTDEVSVQAILGFLGTLNTYAGRGLYRFTKEELWNLYGYGMLGAWSHSYTGVRLDGFQVVTSRETETVLGFGAGAGIEYDWRAWSPGLPPIFWNLEAGIGFVNFDNYNFSSFMIGAGAHFRF